VVRQLNTGAEGCAPLGDLPSDRSWTVQWHRSSSLPVPNVRAVAEVRAPDGRIVRTYELRADRGWEFVFLPLDPVTELGLSRSVDLSPWPGLTLALLNFDRGEASPRPASWTDFQAWASHVSTPHGMGRWEVVGHTDDTGSAAANAPLSLERATFVARHLTETLGWPETVVAVRGAGSTEPLGEDPAQNRRVEVRWVPAVQ
jgi:hypothetical protein